MVLNLSFSLYFFFLPAAAHINTQTGAHTVFRESEFTSSEQSPQGLRGSPLPSFPTLFPSPSLSLIPYSHTFSSQSPRAETLMKTNARNQFAASSLHLAGARLCASISTAAGGELFQNSPITHTSVLRRSYRLRALLSSGVH